MIRTVLALLVSLGLVTGSLAMPESEAPPPRKKKSETPAAAQKAPAKEVKKAPVKAVKPPPAKPVAKAPAKKTPAPQPAPKPKASDAMMMEDSMMMDSTMMDSMAPAKKPAAKPAKKVNKPAVKKPGKAPVKPFVATLAKSGELFDVPNPVEAEHPLDKLVFARLKTLGIPTYLCSDAVFVRRAFLDITGTLPTAEAARIFINMRDPNKRAKLIKRLMGRKAYADYWAMRWGDVLRIKAEFPINLWPNAAQAYHRWVRASIVDNKPYDQFAREMLTSSGSNFRVGPVNFYRAMQNKTPEGIAATVALTFMGARSENWPADRQDGLTQVFSQLGYKPTSEWKEEVVFWNPLSGQEVPGLFAPGNAKVTTLVSLPAVKETEAEAEKAPEPLKMPGPVTVTFPDGEKVELPPNVDPRDVFADWLISPDNPWFTRSIVNRTWGWIFGRGIVHEPDDIRDDNPPSNPELLAYLEQEFIGSGYDLQHLHHLIFTSRTYQLTSTPWPDNPQTEAQFGRYAMRRLDAEVLIDAINRITGTTDLYTSAIPEPFTYIPKNMPAVAIADGSITSSFLALFGRSSRATGMENERNNNPVPSQALHMLNSGHIQQKLEKGLKLKALYTSGSLEEIVERLYLTILSRFPTEEEVKLVKAYGTAGARKRSTDWVDISWALMNSPEFLYRH